MTAPPTWRDLGRRARQLGLRLAHGRHGAWLRGRDYYLGIDSWVTHRADAIILRTAVAAALEQLEKIR